jgi:hypothetical protein
MFLIQIAIIKRDVLFSVEIWEWISKALSGALNNTNLVSPAYEDLLVPKNRGHERNDRVFCVRFPQRTFKNCMKKIYISSKYIFHV